MNINSNSLNNLWKADKYLSEIKFNDFDLLSLDIFDTILFRTCEKPANVFYELGKKAVELGYVKQHITPIEFQQLRILAEQRAREVGKKTRSSEEIALTDIYHQFPDIVVDETALMNLEVDMEAFFCYLNPSVVSLIKESHNQEKKIILVSDMYLSSSQITKILTYNNFPMELVDRLYVSNEEQNSKWEGSLYKEVLNDFSHITPNRILHIGDNQQSDVASAARYNISSLFYGTIPTAWNSVFEWEKVRYGEGILSELLALRKLAGALSAEYKKDDRFWYELGSHIFGPFLSAFADWVVQIAKQENRKGVYCFMREGTLLKSLIEKSAAFHEVELEVKEIYVSRQSTFLAGIKRFDRKVISTFFNRRNFTLSDLLSLLNITSDKLTSDIKKYQSSNLNDLIYEEKETIITFLLKEDIQLYIQDVIREKRKSLNRYLKEEMTYFDDAITVDLGFQGTIQKAMETSLSLEGYGGKRTHLLAIGGEFNKFHLLNNMDIRGFAGSAGENQTFIKTIIRSPEPIEQMMMSNCGSTVGYYYSNDVKKMVPKLDAYFSNQDEVQLKEKCVDGIMSFQQLWFYLKSCKKINEDMIFKKKEFCKLIHRLIDFPAQQEALLIGNLSHDDNFGSKAINKICSSHDERLIRELGTENFLEGNLMSFNSGRVYWPQGTATKNDPGYLFKTFIKYHDSTNYLSTMTSLIHSIKKQKVKKIIIYGAGEAGRSLLQVAQLFGIQVDYIVDKNPSLWGFEIAGVKILPLTEAMHKSLDVYAIGSFAYAKEIKKEIESTYKEHIKTPLIFSPMG